MPDIQPLAPGTRLVHIGPYKTGTTAVQHAFHTRREQVADEGVHYAGRGIQPYRQVIALTGAKGRRGHVPADISVWEELVAEIDDAGDQRVVLSCESLANAHRPAIERLYANLGPERVHVVRMLRRYDKMLPSKWQQSVMGGLKTSFDPWLKNVIADPDHDFWFQHGNTDLTDRWAEVVGPENITLVVVDETDRDFLSRTFEQLLDLSPGLLKPVAGGENRSLARGEVEMLRRFNQIVTPPKWRGEVHERYIRFGASRSMKTQPRNPDDPSVATPEWAYAPLAERAEREIAALRAAGFRVIGDLDLLHVPTRAERPANPTELEPGTVLADVVALAASGVVKAALAKPPIPLFADPDGSGQALGDGAGRRGAPSYSRREIARVLGRRAVRKLKGVRRG